MSRPRIRTIKPEFFQDERINSISRDARYLTVGLISRADDRGRQQYAPLNIMGHVFPWEDVTQKQLKRWLDEIISVEIVLPYEVKPFRYLWFPHFWEHQKVNRPTESECPSHPDDPYGHLGIANGLGVFRGELTEDSVSRSVSPHDDLIPSRARASDAGGSVPIPSPSDVSTEEKKQLDARAQAVAPSDVERVFDAWIDATERTGQTKLDVGRRRIIEKALTSHGLDDCLAAVRNIGADVWARGKNDRRRRFDDIKHALGDAERIERWRDATLATNGDKSWRALGEAAIQDAIKGDTP